MDIDNCMQTPCAPSSPSADVASLRAALSMIEDWELDFDFLFPEVGDSPSLETAEETRPQRQQSCSTTSASTNGGESSRAPYKPRNHRRLEILALREHAERLQRQLDATTRTAEEAAIARAQEEERDLQGLEGVWEDISHRQLMQRYFAEAENSELRAELKNQIQTSRQLLNNSTRALKAQSLVPRPIHPVEDFYKEFLPPLEHSAELDELFSETSSVFSRPAFASGRKEFQSIQVTDDGTNGTLVVFEVSLLLPFDVATVADALFQHTVRMTSNERVYEFKNLLQPDKDSLVSLFVGLSAGDGVRGTMQGQIATKKITTSPDSAVVVSKMYAGVLKTDFIPFSMSGEGWLRCVEVHKGLATTSTASDPKTSPLTQVQWFRCFRTRPLSPTPTVAWSDLHGVIMTRVKHSLDWNLQAVENLLLTQSQRKLGRFLRTC